MEIVQFHPLLAFAKKACLLKQGFRCNESFRRFHVRHCNASLLRRHPWEESKFPVWPPSTVHGVPHLRLATQNTEPVWKSFPQKKTCPIAPTCTKCVLNYPSRSWNLPRTRVQKPTCAFGGCTWGSSLKKSHRGWSHTLLPNSHLDLRTHTWCGRPEFSPYSA